MVVAGTGIGPRVERLLVPLRDVFAAIFFCWFGLTIAPSDMGGVRISTDRPEFGGLSGCTFEESKSWGKYAAEARFESVVCDATIALPVLVSALLERRAQ